VINVALACGFASLPHFSNATCAHYNTHPLPRTRQPAAPCGSELDQSAVLMLPASCAAAIPQYVLFQDIAKFFGLCYLRPPLSRKSEIKNIASLFGRARLILEEHYVNGRVT